MADISFDVEYAKLNDAQRSAVDAIDGPVMVIAGPGTGKTQVLTLRIANIIRRTDTQPEQILALTFTEAATQNMRRRLAGLIGNRAYRVVINTFHGFCNDIIKRYPEDFPRIIGSKSITEVEQVSIIESIIEDGEYVLLKPWGDMFLYVRDIVSAISDLKREGVTPKAFEKIIAQEQKEFKSIPDLYHEKGAHKGKMKGEYQKLERKILKNEELAKIYAQYQKALTERKEYDFSDMILEVLTTLEASPTLLQILQEEHQYVLVDEHQDTNNAQNKILELLLSYHDNPNLFIVGDEKQAIFRFQGASLENFQYLQKKYPSVQLITLTENYRSIQGILDTSEKLLPSEKPLKASRQNVLFSPSSQRVPVSSKKEHSVALPICIGEFSSESAERYFVAHDIKEKIDFGIVSEEIAILYRNNKDAFPVARDLERLGIPYQIESDQDLFSHPDIQAILAILRAVAQYGDNEQVTAVLHLPLFGIDPLDAYKVLRNASDRKIYSVYDILSDAKLLSEIRLHDAESVASLGKKLKTWVRESRKKDLVQFFEYLLRDSGLLENIIGSSDSMDRFSAVNAFFGEIQQFTDRKQEGKLKEFFVYLDTVQKHKLFLKRTAQNAVTGKVRLMTVHKSKGQEFAHVYVIRAIDGVFGGKIDRDRLPLLEKVYALSGSTGQVQESGDDERRLFYVALTRAKESVTITHARMRDDGREALPSQFIEEIQSELVTDIHAEEWEEKYRADPGFQYVSSSSNLERTSGGKNKKEIQQYVSELFAKQGLSPTALNNYLECPWKYFYQNLIRIPSAQSIHQIYGIAAHGALQDFFKRINDEETGKEFLVESFMGHLNRLSVHDKDRKDLLEKGTNALSGWYDAYHGSWNTNVITELRIKGVEISCNEKEPQHVLFSPSSQRVPVSSKKEHVGVPDLTVKLTGVLDKVEFIEDGIVHVVDYKTGKPKTRNDLMGKTKSGDGNYYRQLVFYKLLLKYFDEGKYNMQSGTIDFIEPDEKGKYHKETFEIPDEEVTALEVLITKTAEEITGLHFWDKGCKKKDCEFCRLRDLVNKRDC